MKIIPPEQSRPLNHRSLQCVLPWAAVYSILVNSPSSEVLNKKSFLHFYMWENLMGLWWRSLCPFICEVYSINNLSYHLPLHHNPFCFSLQVFCFTAFYLHDGIITALKLPWIMVQILTTVLLMGSLYFYKPVSKLMILKKYVWISWKEEQIPIQETQYEYFGN